MEREKDNLRYFAEKRKQQDISINMVEHWQPPEDRNWQAAPRPQRPLKIPKVREPKDSKDNKSDTSSSHLESLRKLMDRAREKVSDMVGRAKTAHAKAKNNKVAPIHTKVQSRHLELEPLCCLSSCLVRGGCNTVVVFEIVYIVLTLLCVLIGMSRGGFTLWEKIPSSVNGMFGHHLFYYAIVAYDIALLIAAVGLLRGLFTFDKLLVKAHYYFCFVSLIVNVLFLAFSVWALSLPGVFSWSPLNVTLVLCFAMQIPLQLWALTVVKSCRDFFGLIHVFVALAES